MQQASELMRDKYPPNIGVSNPGDIEYLHLAKNIPEYADIYTSVNSTGHFTSSQRLTTECNTETG